MTFTFETPDEVFAFIAEADNEDMRDMLTAIYAAGAYHVSTGILHVIDQDEDPFQQLKEISNVH